VVADRLQICLPLWPRRRRHRGPGGILNGQAPARGLIRVLRRSISEISKRQFTPDTGAMGAGRRREKRKGGDACRGGDSSAFLRHSLDLPLEMDPSRSISSESRRRRSRWEGRLVRRPAGGEVNVSYRAARIINNTTSTENTDKRQAAGG